MKLVMMATDPATVAYLMRGQIRRLVSNGAQVTVISSPGEILTQTAEREGCQAVAIPMRRAITPFQDFLSLVRVARVLRRVRPDVVSAGTPKAALLGMLASWAVRVPRRYYLVRGLRLETTTGLRRKVLWTMEWLTCKAATEVVCVSQSLKTAIVKERLVAPRRALVVGPGSSNGIDLDRFNQARGHRDRVRARLFGEEQPFVIGFVGRISADKGIGDILFAVDQLRQRGIDARALVVGEPDASDPPQPDVLSRLRNHAFVICVGQADPVEYYGAMDVFAFPSRREGLPNAPLEASAAGLPTVGYRVTGTSDVIVNGVTGALVPPEASSAFADATARYAASEELCRRHGEAAAQFVRRFEREKVWAAYERFYYGAQAEDAEAFSRR